MENFLSLHEYFLSGYECKTFSLTKQIKGLEQQLDDKWKVLVQGNEYKSITTWESAWVRVKHVGLGVFAAPIDMIDAGIGAFTGIFTVLSAIISGASGGRISGPWNGGFLITIRQLNSLGRFLPTVFEHMLKTVDPSTEVVESRALVESSALQETIRDWARLCLTDDHIAVRHVASRILYVALAVVSVISRVLGGTIGVLCAIGSLVASPFTAFGVLDRSRVKWLNVQAYRGLFAPVLISELFYCLIKVINPFAGTERQSGNKLVFLGIDDQD